jgi:hypothetical protein
MLKIGVLVKLQDIGIVVKQVVLGEVKHLLVNLFKLVPKMEFNFKIIQILLVFVIKELLICVIIINRLLLMIN